MHSEMGPVRLTVMMTMTVVVVIVVVVVVVATTNTVNLDLLQHVSEAHTLCCLKSDFISIIVVSRCCVVDSTAADIDGNQTAGDTVSVIVLKCVPVHTALPFFMKISNAVTNTSSL